MAPANVSVPWTVTAPNEPADSVRVPPGATDTTVVPGVGKAPADGTAGGAVNGSSDAKVAAGAVRWLAWTTPAAVRSSSSVELPKMSPGTTSSWPVITVNGVPDESCAAPRLPVGTWFRSPSPMLPEVSSVNMLMLGAALTAPAAPPAPAVPGAPAAPAPPAVPAAPDAPPDPAAPPAPPALPQVAPKAAKSWTV